MKTYRRILVVLGFFLLLLFLVSFFLPSKVRVERSKEFSVPPEVLFPYVNNYRYWNEWNPWGDLDPNVSIFYSGPKEGVGAYYKWKSENPRVGSGSMLITVSDPNRLVVNSLYFDHQGTTVSKIYLDTVGLKGAKLTWTLESDLGTNPIRKYAGLFMESMVGERYEKGLDRLQTLVKK